MRTQFGKTIRESDVCVLCAERVASTKEHIPPKGLFAKLPRDYLLVPACDECNNSTKLDDEYFRQVMAASSQTPEGRRVWKTKVLPKLNEFPRTKAALRERLLRVPIEVRGHGIVEFPCLVAASERVNVVVHKMVKGLYWAHTGEVMPRRTLICVRVVNVARVEEYFGDEERLRVFRKARWRVYADPDAIRTFADFGAIGDGVSMWYLFIYRQNLCVAWTEHATG